MSLLKIVEDQALAIAGLIYLIVQCVWAKRHFKRIYKRLDGGT
jgi:hypothetical protein